MADFGIDIDPAEAGFDQQRLLRIDEHFKGYVDSGRLAGWRRVGAERPLRRRRYVSSDGSAAAMLASSWAASVATVDD